MMIHSVVVIIVADFEIIILVDIVLVDLVVVLFLIVQVLILVVDDKVAC